MAKSNSIVLTGKVVNKSDSRRDIACSSRTPVGPAADHEPGQPLPRAVRGAGDVKPFADRHLWHQNEYRHRHKASPAAQGGGARTREAAPLARSRPHAVGEEQRGGVAPVDESQALSCSSLPSAGRDLAPAIPEPPSRLRRDGEKEAIA